MFSNFHRKKLDELLSAARHNLSSRINDSLITNAYRFALEAHKNDKRASGEPYITHPYEVAMILCKEIPIDDVTIASALLHDVVEDTKFTVKDIEAEFGNQVAELVNGATQIEGIFENYEVRAVESYKKLLLSMTSDVRIIIIKFADRIHNLRTLEFLSPARQYRIAKETLEIFAPFANRFGLSAIKTELEDLSFKYLDRKTYDELAKKLKEKKREREKFINKFVEPIKETLKKEGFKFEVYGRAKHLYSIYRKLQTRVKSFDEIYDLFAVRIILDTENKYDCYSVLGMLSEIYTAVPERIKDYISLPKKNGYRSIHTTVLSNEGKLVEVQIRTREMHEVAEKGIAAHWKYKEGMKLTDQNLEEWMKWIRETIENAAKDEVPSDELLESFKLNLYQDELYCFTPKGDLIILPQGATTLDFAFEIHTEIGIHTIGGKVNGKIVSLDTPLKSGSQIEILTSKNQTPKRDWEKFVITNKAKQDIKKYFNTERRLISSKGKELVEKKFKKHKIHINEDDLQKVIKKFRYKYLSDYYFDIAKNESKLDELINYLEDKSRNIYELQKNESNKPPEESEILEKFVETARATSDGISIGKDGDMTYIKGLKYEFAKCCNPIPGDEVIGYISHNEGIKIHRKSCNNIVNLFLMDPNRIVEVNWGEAGITDFTGGVKLIGEDIPGLLNEITEVISKSFKRNIRSVNIFTKGSLFEGTIIFTVENVKQLTSIIEKLSSHKGIISASRIHS